MSNPRRVLRFQSDSVDATEQLAARLGATLQGSECITLHGDLGAGKTAFTRGLVDGVQEGEGDFVASPTYAVCHVYETQPEVHHYDLYRLESEDDLESVGFYDSIGEPILVVEWPEKVPSVLARTDLRVQLTRLSEDERAIEIAAHSVRGETCLDALLEGKPLNDT